MYIGTKLWNNIPHEIKNLEAIHKRRPQSRGVCPVRTICEQGREGILQMRTSVLFGSKTFEFFKIYGVSARTRRGFVQCGHFSDKGGNFFAILCGVF